jgi:hypothetical protein
LLGGGSVNDVLGVDTSNKTRLVELEENILVGLLEDGSANKMTGVESLKGLAVLLSEGRGVLARNGESAEVGIHAQGVNIEDLSLSEMLGRVLDVGLTHLRNRKESTDVTVELDDSAVGLKADNGTRGLRSRCDVFVVFPDGRLAVEQTLLQGQADLALLDVDGENSQRKLLALTELLLRELKLGVGEVHGWDKTGDSIGQVND